MASNVPVFQTSLQPSYDAQICPVPEASSPNQSMFNLRHASPHNNCAIAMSYAMPVPYVDQIMHYSLEPQEIQRQVKVVAGQDDTNRRLWSSSSQQNTVHTTSCSSNVLWSRTPVERSHTLDNPSVLAEAE